MAETNETIRFDIDKMTLGELEQIEEIAGLDAVQRLQSGQMTAKTLLAVAFIVKRRTDPQVTLEEVRSIPVTAFGSPEQTAEGKGEDSGS